MWGAEVRNQGYTQAERIPSGQLTTPPLLAQGCVSPSLAAGLCPLWDTCITASEPPPNRTSIRPSHRPGTPAALSLT